MQWLDKKISQRGLPSLIPLKTVILCLYCFSLTTCSFGAGGVLGNGVDIGIVHPEGSRSTSGRLVIHKIGDKSYKCRASPLTSEVIDTSLSEAGVPKEVIDRYFVSDDQDADANQGGGTGGTNDDSNPSIYTEVGNNYIKFGLIIRNTTKNALIIYSISLTADGFCGGEEEVLYTQTIQEGYCSSPYLYIVPPTGEDTVINYSPGAQGEPLESLSLFFDGFTIFNPNQAKDFEYPKGCEPKKGKRYPVVPKYRGELVIEGYFISNTEELEQVNFTEIVPIDLSTEFL